MHDRNLLNFQNVEEKLLGEILPSIHQEDASSTSRYKSSHKFVFLRTVTVFGIMSRSIRGPATEGLWDTLA